LKPPPDNFNILDYLSFIITTTRSSSRNNLAVNYRRTNAGRHFYFNRIVRSWNSLLLYHLSELNWPTFYGINFKPISHQITPAPTISAAPVQIVTYHSIISFISPATPVEVLVCQLPL